MPPRSRSAAATRPVNQEISATQAADRLGLTKQAIGLWCAKPGAPVRKEGTRVFVRWPDFARWREQELQASAKRDEPEAGSFADRRRAAEARLAEIQMERDEIALARERGEVVAVADYEAALGTVLDRLVARLRGLPARLEHLGPEAEAAVEAEAERLIEELQGWDEDVVEEEPTPDQPTDAVAA